MKIEERRLPPFLSYINARLTGRPLHTGIWVVVMLLTFFGIYILDSGRGRRGDFIMYIIGLYLCVVVAALVSLGIRAEGRKWLLSVYDDGGGTSVTPFSRIVIRLLPVFGLGVVVEYWLSK